MKPNARTRIAGALIACLSCAAAWAGPLDLARVDRGARWVVHVDVERAVSSSVGAFLNETAPEFRAGIARVKLQFGVDPRGDIKGITVYGLAEDGGDNGVAVVECSAAADALLKKIAAEGVDYSSAETEAGVAHHWTQDGKPAWCIMVGRPEGAPSGGDRRELVFASSKSRVVAAAEVVNGKRDALSGVNEEPLPGRPGPGSILFGAARGLDALTGGKPNAAIVKSARTLVLDVGEREGADGKEVYADATLTVSDAEAAQRVRKMAEGLLAMVQMAAANEPGGGAAAGFLTGVKVENEALAVGVHVKMKSSEVVEALKEMRELSLREQREGKRKGKGKGGEKGEEKQER